MLVEALQIAQHEYRTVLGTEPAEHGLDVDRQLRSVRRRYLRKVYRSRAPRPAGDTDSLADSDRAYPAVQGGRFAQGTELPVDSQKRLLCGVGAVIERNGTAQPPT